MSEARFVPLGERHDPGLPPTEAARRFYETLRMRRTVREFSARPVARETLEWILRAAGSAPSGANKQPWRFVCVQDPALKRRIRLAAEEEERAFYESRASARWLEDLAPLGTDASKPFLESAPWLVVVFKLTRGDQGEQHYYVDESVGLAAGFLIAAAHMAGLASLTHTPSPMGFLNRVLERPAHERPVLLVPLGYPTEDCRVPAAALAKKPLAEISAWH